MKKKRNKEADKIILTPWFAEKFYFSLTIKK